MKTVLITGGSGFIGRRLSQELIKRGDRVTVLTRDASKARGKAPPGLRVAGWTPTQEGPWYDELDTVDAVVHLAGELVAQRWNAKKKKEIVESRVASTERLVEAMGRAKHKPKVLVCASATGFYGARDPNEELDETSARGSGFLAELVENWENAAKRAEEHGIRTAMLRIGVVFGKGGGALDKMVLPLGVSVAGPIGSGEQIYSWIHLEDVVGMILMAIDDERATGPINATSPYPESAGTVAKQLGITLNRPAFRVPTFLVKSMMGEAAEILTDSQRVVPRRAIELGYEFRHARLVPALESIFGE